MLQKVAIIFTKINFLNTANLIIKKRSENYIFHDIIAVIYHLQMATFPSLSSQFSLTCEFAHNLPHLSLFFYVSQFSPRVLVLKVKWREAFMGRNEYVVSFHKQRWMFTKLKATKLWNWRKGFRHFYFHTFVFLRERESALRGSFIFIFHFSLSFIALRILLLIFNFKRKRKTEIEERSHEDFWECFWEQINKKLYENWNKIYIQMEMLKVYDIFLKVKRF